MAPRRVPPERRGRRIHQTARLRGRARCPAQVRQDHGGRSVSRAADRILPRVRRHDDARETGLEVKLSRQAALLVVWVAAVLVVSAQVTVYRHANFEIFRPSWHNLLAGKNLYASYPPLDVFIYTPTFAVLFAPFALLPLWLGILLWNAANAGALYWGLGRALEPREAFVARVI